MYKEVADTVEAEDEAEDNDKDADEETGAADGVATATERRSRRTRGYATTVPKRGTSNRTVRLGNEPPRFATKTS